MASRSPSLRTRCARNPSPDGLRQDLVGSRAHDRARSISSTSAALGLSPRTSPSKSRRSLYPTSPQFAEARAEAVTGRRRGDRAPSPLRSSSPSASRPASALLSPPGRCGGGSPPSWRPAALTTVRSPLAPVVRHRATASIDMEQLWADASFDECGAPGGGEAKSPDRRRNRGIVRVHARNLSLSDFRTFRGSATPLSRIFNSRGGRDSNLAPSAAVASVGTAAPAAVFGQRDGCASPGTAADRTGDNVAARLVASESFPPPRAMRDRNHRGGIAGLAAAAAAATGAAVPPKSPPPPRWRGGSRGSTGGRSPTGVSESETAGRVFSEASEPATVVPFAAREECRDSQQQSHPSHRRSRSWGQLQPVPKSLSALSKSPEPIFSSIDSELLRVSQQQQRWDEQVRPVGDGGETSGNDGEKDVEMDSEMDGEMNGEGSRGPAAAVRHHDEMMNSDFLEYFGEVAQSWQ
ncbi:hypothetical protein CLOM_g19122 [Closterium sp. NIES-68]|nr:hypothetical protein CLOM_g19122 [Closterium sp. NIES-68]GJP59461.1 hypothetical protein CLOP_g12254 [Closterium sp. NIES-67]